MSKESLEQFVTQIADSEELRASIENQLDSDGNISADAVTGLGPTQPPRGQQLKIQQ